MKGDLHTPTCDACTLLHLQCLTGESCIDHLHDRKLHNVHAIQY